MIKINPFFTALLILSLLVPASAFAGPEAVPLKSEERKIREKLAEQNIRKIDISRIQDLGEWQVKARPLQIAIMRI